MRAMYSPLFHNVDSNYVWLLSWRTCGACCFPEFKLQATATAVIIFTLTATFADISVNLLKISLGDGT